MSTQFYINLACECSKVFKKENANAENEIEKICVSEYFLQIIVYFLSFGSVT